MGGTGACGQVTVPEGYQLQVPWTGQSRWGGGPRSSGLHSGRCIPRGARFHDPLLGAGTLDRACLLPHLGSVSDQPRQASSPSRLRKAGGLCPAGMGWEITQTLKPHLGQAQSLNKRGTGAPGRGSLWPGRWGPAGEGATGCHEWRLGVGVTERSVKSHTWEQCHSRSLETG